MSDWQTHGIEQKVIDILRDQQTDHHFGRPYLTAYQLAIEFRKRHEYIRPDLPVGGQGTGAATGRNSLARYLAAELSQRIKARMIPVEGAFISNEHLSDISFREGGKEIHSTLTDSGYPLSMFRLLDGKGKE